MNPYFGQEISVESLILSCGDLYCRPSSYCRRQQFMPVLSVHIVAGDNIMYANFDTFFQAILATIYDLNFETSCFRRQNMPLTLTKIVTANSTVMETKYKILSVLSHKT